ncbi:hypothetical protein PV762_26970 [Mitsuaria sp. CC2]|uniref:hypothetical protein n=1 Tax=Mitsuaria sp. CC2 TaxID=3029186 RepID=UPI003B8BF3E6
MASYLQLGHESWNLLEEPDIGDYSGLVLSPVNDGPDDVANRLERLGELRDDLEVILDPQMYNPAFEKGKMDEWAYFSADFATADQSDVNWWVQRGHEIVEQGAQLAVDAVCSPAFVPRLYSDAYYSLMVDVADQTKDHADGRGLETLLTAIVSLRDLNNPARALSIASILSRSSCDRIYLTFLNEDVPPREPLWDEAGLPTAVHLVRLLSQSMRVHVAFASHDLVMWKFAGATDISTGKYMNLRRFSPGRWKEEEPGGRQVAYWNEGPLLARLREADVAKLNRKGWFDERNFDSNPAGGRILEIIRSGVKAPWLKLSWMQYLRWASNMEARWHGNSASAERSLVRSDGNWGEIEDVLFQDRFNDGSHVREWLNAVREGSRR